MPGEPDRSPLVLWLGAIALLLICVAGFGSIGDPLTPASGLAAALTRVVPPLIASVLVIASGYAPAALLTTGLRSAFPLRLALSTAIVLTACWFAAVLGVIDLFAPLALVAGAITLGVSAYRNRQTPTPRLHPVFLLAMPGAALLLVASGSLPGLLWSSEFGGYDALSYHLQLPREWQAGAPMTLEYNVYSFLPGYVESAYALFRTPVFTGLLGQDAQVIGPQVFHAVLTLGTGVIIASAASRLVERCGVEQPNASAMLAGIMLIATPWIIVTGSLAYNELGVVALGSGALLAAIDDRLTPSKRAVIIGFLVGTACGCKPTALFLVGPGVGVAMLAFAPRREWARLIGIGTVAGLLTLSSWLIRNGLATANPVFPHLTDLFGTGHWTEEQAARYASAHQFDGSFLDRLQLLVLPDPSASPDSPHVVRFRGLNNTQWAAIPYATLAACVLLLARQQTRRAGLVLMTGLILGLVGWLTLTHLQSRFLIPLAGFACVAAGLALTTLPRAAAIGIGCVLVLLQTVTTARLFSKENGGNPNTFLGVTLGEVTGDAFEAELARLDPQSAEHATVLQYANHALPPGSVVYLLGDSTPLYWNNAVYSTTWDTWPIGDAIRATPDDPSAWSRVLRDRGITHVSVNLSELGRLRSSGYADPDVTPERVQSWLATLGAPLHTEPNAARYLFGLP